jgi:hypothetical protein
MTLATPTIATIEDYRERYGRETIQFGTIDGPSYHWYRSPYLVLNYHADGTRTTYETEQVHRPLPVSHG